MPRATPGFAKNMMRRALREIVDPSPSAREVEAIWAFFRSRCAYCGSKLSKTKKEGHIDHLTSASQGGVNHISNRVLSCADCNEKEKLDQPWEQFLSNKVSDPELRGERRSRILAWQGKHPQPPYLHNTSTLEAIDALAQASTADFDAKVAQARSLRHT